MRTKNQLEQRVAALQSDLNARDQALDDAATENNERELSRRDWFDEAQRLENENSAIRLQAGGMQIEIDEMRAQLAERDALLREFLEVATGGFLDGDHVLRVRRHLEAALSASAEPVSVAYDCCANCMRPEVEHLPQGYCPRPFTTVWHAWTYEFRPTERDERAEFEAYYEDLSGLPAEEIKSWRKGAGYSNSYERCGISWEAWQARAALERKPAEQPKPCATLRLERMGGQLCATVARWDADQLQEGSLLNVYLNPPTAQRQGEPVLYVEQWELDRIANGGAAWATAWTTDGKENPSRPGDCVALYTQPADLQQLLSEAYRRIEELERYKMPIWPSEDQLIDAGLGYPIGKELAVKIYKAALKARTDTPENADCEWCYGVGHDYYGEPCCGCCKPAPEKLAALIEQASQACGGAVVLPERMPTGNNVEGEHNRLSPGVREGWNLCLDEVARLNPPQQ